MNVPVCLFVGGKDSFGDPEDVAILEKALPKKPWVHTEPSYTHLGAVFLCNYSQDWAASISFWCIAFVLGAHMFQTQFGDSMQT